MPTVDAMVYVVGSILLYPIGLYINSITFLMSSNFSSQQCLSHTFFFFFQAEDGIRDVAVTGVQTCALPISHPFGQGHLREPGIFPHLSNRQRQVNLLQCSLKSLAIRRALPRASLNDLPEIGRASCRERV